jgi:hypothetical protein
MSSPAGSTNDAPVAFRLACSEARQRAQIEQDRLAQQQTDAAILNNRRRGVPKLAFAPADVKVSESPADVIQQRTKDGDFVFSFPLHGEFVDAGTMVQVVVSSISGVLKAEPATITHKK